MSSIVNIVGLLWSSGCSRDQEVPGSVPGQGDSSLTVSDDRYLGAGVKWAKLGGHVTKSVGSAPGLFEEGKTKKKKHVGNT